MFARRYPVFAMGLGGETEDDYFPFGSRGENTTKRFSFSSGSGGVKRIKILQTLSY